MFIEVLVPAGVQTTVIEFCIWDLALATAPVTFTLFACAIWRKCNTLWETLNTSKDQIEKIETKSKQRSIQQKHYNIGNKTTLKKRKRCNTKCWTSHTLLSPLATCARDVQVHPVRLLRRGFGQGSSELDLVPWTYLSICTKL